MGHQPQLPNKPKFSALSRRGLYLSHGDIFIRYQWPSSEPYVQVSPHTALRVILELIDPIQLTEVGPRPGLLVWVRPLASRQDEQYKVFTYNVIICSLWAP